MAPLLVAALLITTPALVDAAESPPTGPGGAGGTSATQPFRGLFQYLADAALFTDCLTGKRYPVANEAGYLELERAYLAPGQAPGAPVLVQLRGYLGPRPAIEGTGNRETLIVEGLDALMSGGRCTPPPG